MIRGAIFDLDGVLVTTDEYHYRAWKRMAERHGIPYDRSVQERQRGVSRMASLELMLEPLDREFTDAEKQAMADEKNGYYRESLQELSEGDVLPGARETLRGLRERGVKTAIASSSRNAPTINERLGFDALVDATVDGNDIEHSKPHPEVFLLSAERLGLEPAVCLVVEDAQAGIDAARRAAMAALGIGSPDELTGADRVVGSLAEIAVDELLALGGR
ncbi:MAG: beta-phosphoglucomutase [Planctomycetota bacterium]